MPAAASSSSMLLPSSVPGRPVHDAGPVKVVAAGFHHGIDQQAAPRHLRVAAHGLHPRPVDRVEVHVAALRAGGRGGGRQHPFEHLPRRTVLAVGPEHHRVAQTGRADVQVRAHPRHLVQEGVEPIAGRREHVQLFLRELGRGGRRRRIHERRRAGDRNRLGHGADVHLRVHSGIEPDGQPHTLAPDVLKSRQLEEDGVDANRQRRQTVLTPLVRDTGD